MSKLFVTYFVDGFLYMLGLESNPLQKHADKLANRNDCEAIANDWRKVGIDIRKAFDLRQLL